MEIINERTGEILQSRVFEAYSNDKKEYYKSLEGNIPLNAFLRQNTEKIHSIVPLHVGRYGRIIVFYYDKLEE